MIEKVKTLKRHVILNLLNVDFKAKAEDIEELYSNVKFLRIEPQQRGIWLIETENSEEALKILAGEEKVRVFLRILLSFVANCEFYYCEEY